MRSIGSEILEIAIKIYKKKFTKKTTTTPTPTQQKTNKQTNKQKKKTTLTYVSVESIKRLFSNPSLSSRELNFAGSCIF